ncbi:hypothetical protein JRQ81_006839 [Phrynocephalus forsythii]|uniref:Uncharacterized protein n=1 Tax=Phrynocephalus forsythii TaxID=171643 RepID=A0A9Q0XDW7_9SAUR|nr:hypothetical protein JRQ81_006839 [Phrynocephalus forsythii]
MRGTYFSRVITLSLVCLPNIRQRLCLNSVSPALPIFSSGSLTVAHLSISVNLGAQIRKYAHFTRPPLKRNVSHLLPQYLEKSKDGSYFLYPSVQCMLLHFIHVCTKRFSTNTGKKEWLWLGDVSGQVRWKSKKSRKMTRKGEFLKRLLVLNVPSLEPCIYLCCNKIRKSVVMIAEQTYKLLLKDKVIDIAARINEDKSKEQKLLCLDLRPIFALYNRPIEGKVVEKCISLIGHHVIFFLRKAACPFYQGEQRHYSSGGKPSALQMFWTTTPTVLRHWQYSLGILRVVVRNIWSAEGSPPLQYRMTTMYYQILECRLWWKKGENTPITMQTKNVKAHHELIMYCPEKYDAFPEQCNLVFIIASSIFKNGFLGKKYMIADLLRGFCKVLITHFCWVSALDCFVLFDYLGICCFSTMGKQDSILK